MAQKPIPEIKMASLGDVTEHGALLSFEYLSGGSMQVMLSECEIRYLVSMGQAQLTKLEEALAKAKERKDALGKA